MIRIDRNNLEVKVKKVLEKILFLFELPAYRKRIYNAIILKIYERKSHLERKKNLGYTEI
jgi:hypothetical protein